MINVPSRRQFVSTGLAFGTILAAPSLAAAPRTPARGSEDIENSESLRKTFLRGLAMSDREPGVTSQFADLEATRPWLADTRKCVGQLCHRYMKDGTEWINPLGTLTLLDDEGTFVFDAHEYQLMQRTYGPEASNIALYFNFGNSPFYLAEFSIDTIDTQFDVAFGHVPERLWASAKPRTGLIPVDFGSTDIQSLLGQEVLMVGYPSMSLIDGNSEKRYLIHAARGSVNAFMDSQNVTMEDGRRPYPCRVRTSAPVLNAMSGGAAFCSGKYLGPLVVGNRPLGPNSDPMSTFVPLAYLLGAYQDCYPDRARRRGFNGPIPNTPLSCTVERTPRVLAPGIR